MLHIPHISLTILLVAYLAGRGVSPGQTSAITIPDVAATDRSIVPDIHGAYSSQPGAVPCSAWAIGLESEPSLLDAAFNTVDLDSQWFDTNNDCAFYPLAACIYQVSHPGKRGADTCPGPIIYKLT